MPILYRWGNQTPSNFTPRPADNDGLSTNIAMPPADTRAQVIDSNIIQDTIAVQTGNNLNHYSIQPSNGMPASMATWQQTRADFAGANNTWDVANGNPNYFRTTGVNEGQTGEVN